MKILISQGTVVCPANHIEKVADLAIENGCIKHLGEIPASFTPDYTIVANNKLVIPGIVDLCNRPHLKHPQGNTMQHEAHVALKCGFTTLCIPPDVDPVIDHPNSVIRITSEDNHPAPNVYSIASLTQGGKGQKMADYSLLKEAGCIALSQAQSPIRDKSFLKSCYEYAQSLGMPVIIQPREYDIAPNGCAHDGVVATRLGLPSIPSIAETIAVQTHLAFVEVLGLRAHFTSLSSMHSVELIANAKAKGLPVTADVSMHALILTEMDLLEYDGNCHLYPPLRSQTDQLALLQAVESGTIDAICSDHRPLDSMAKLAPFSETVPGLSAIDSFLSLGLYLVEKQKLSLSRLVSAMTAKPAQIFNLPQGHLTIGNKADVCVIDPHEYWTLTRDKMLSKGKNSPFVDWQLPGKIEHTIVNGILVPNA